MASRLSAMFAARKAPETVEQPLWQLSRRPKITLQQAARDGKEDVVHTLLEEESLPSKRKQMVNECDEEGMAALHYAAMFNNYRIMEVLVDNDADPNVTTDEDLTPLHFAAKYLPPYPVDATEATDSATAAATAVGVHEEVSALPSSQRAVQLLVSRCKCTVNVKDESGLTPLHMACSRRNHDAVDILLSSPGIEVDLTDDRIHTPLHDACIVGDTWITERLLEKGANLLAPNDDGMIPLHFACRLEQNPALAELILSHSSEIDRLLSATDNVKNTPLHVACDCGATDIVTMLINKGASTVAYDIHGVAPIHIAASHAFIDIADILVKADPANIGLLDLNQMTPLHYAASQNKDDMIEFLLKQGAEMDAGDKDLRTPLLTAALYGKKKAFQCLLYSRASVNVVDKDRKSCVFLATEHNHIDILKILVEDPHGRKLCMGIDASLNTPFHIAAMKGNLDALRVLLRVDIRLDERNENGMNPLHLAAENGHLHIAKELLQHEREGGEERTSIIDDGDEDLNTPLHLACGQGHIRMVEYFLEQYTSPNARNSRLLTPVHSAAAGGWDQILEMLLEAGGEVDVEDSDGTTPLHLACEKGHSKSVELLIQQGAKVTVKRKSTQFNCLDVAIENGREKVAMTIIQSRQWAAALRNCTNEDTPMRKLIRKMPDVAEVVFQRCTKFSSDDQNDEHFQVTFNCEFIEDVSYTKQDFFNKRLDNIGHQLGNIGHQIGKARSLVNLLADDGEEEEDDGEPLTQRRRGWRSGLRRRRRRRHRRGEGDEEEGVGKQKKYWSTTWGPAQFSQSNHPLTIMVESERTNLLKHPLVTTLLDHKWRNYTQFAYTLNLFLYFIFVALLTVFALLVHTPRDCECLEVFGTNRTACGGNQTGNGTGVCSADDSRSTYFPYHFDGDRPPNEYWILFLAAIIIVILAGIRLIMEFFQLLLRRLDYLADWVNWMEITLFLCSILFVWVFHTDCYCERSWQWQVGAVAVFLAWINLVLFVEKIPLTGLYVVMFLNIFYTFMRMIILAFLLVISFSLAFYMLFYKPELEGILTPFATPARSLLKVITMTTGELDFDTLFRNDEQTDDLPYIPASVILWVIFIILMPILLANLLVGLAVGDIQAVQEAATLKRLQLQVELALSVEQRMPTRLRQRLVKGVIKAHPNRRLNPFAKLLYAFWGGRAYDSARELCDALQYQEPHDLVQHQVQQLSSNIAQLRTSWTNLSERFQGLEEHVSRITEIMETESPTRID